MQLKSAGSAGVFGDPGTLTVHDPVAALAALASSRAGSATRVLMLRDAIPYGAAGHIQGLTHLSSARGERCLALCASANGEGQLAFARVAGDGGLSFRRAARVQNMDHPSALGAWRELLALACEDSRRPACLRIYRDPVETVQVVHGDQLVFDGAHGEPVGRPKSGAAWLAWTRLVCGRYFGLVGGHDFGRDHGWAVLYDPSSAAQRFAIPASYSRSVYYGPRIRFAGAGFGDVNNASLIAGTDGTLYLLAIETEGIRYGYGLFKLFRIEEGSREAPIVLRFLSSQRISSQGNASFRWGSCVYVNGDGGLTAVCSERGSGLNVTLFEVGGPAH
jgi:hypothetical protein